MTQLTKIVHSIQNDIFVTAHSKLELKMHLSIWFVMILCMLIKYQQDVIVDLNPALEIRSTIDTSCDISDYYELDSILSNENFRLELLKTKSKQWCLSNSIGKQTQQIHKLKELIKHMQKTMKINGFVCLGAIHVGVPLRIITMNNDVYLNPRLIEMSIDDTFFSVEESALNPNNMTHVQRYRNIKIEYIDSYRITNKESFTGKESLCIQHVLQSFL
jgi:peptide deformylase